MALARRTSGLNARLPVLLVTLICSSLAMGQSKSAKETDKSDSKPSPEPMSLTADAEEQPTTAPAVAPAPVEPKPAAKKPALPFELTSKRMTGDWGGVRNWMDDHFIDLEIVYTSVYQRNFKGGLTTHNADDWDGDLRENLYVDLDKMKLVPGGFIFVRGKSSYNDSVQKNVGCLESTSWTIAGGDNEIFLDKWWYGQRFFKDMIEFRIGKLLTPIDLFDQNNYAMNPWTQFLNQYMDMNPTVPHRKAPGMYLKLKPTDWMYFSSAMLNANQTDAYKPFDTKTTFHNDAKFIGMWELGLTPAIDTAKGKLPGAYRVGFWYDPRPAGIYRDTLGGTRSTFYRGDDIGLYSSFDQLVFKENADAKDKQGLGVFARYGWNKRDINKISDFWSLGAQYQGLIPTRDNDVLAFGMNQSVLSSQYRNEINHFADRETVYELYYAVQITPWISVTPDIQYITEPGGMKNVRDSLVGSIRVKINL